MSIDPCFQRSVLAELARIRQRTGRRRPRLDPARALAERLHRDQHDLMGHLRRVASAVPQPCRPLAWLHHAGERNVAPEDLSAAGLRAADRRTVELLAHVDAPHADDLGVGRLRLIAEMPGPAGEWARLVARADVVDRLLYTGLQETHLTVLTLLDRPER